MQIISLLPYHLQIKILYISCNCKMSCALRQQNGSKLHNYKLLTTTNYFVNPSLWWPIYVFNSVVNTKLLTNYLAGEDLPLWCFHTAGSVVHIIIANERICKLFIYLKASVADLKLAYLYVEKIIHQQGINNNTLTFPPPLPTPTPSLNDICLKNFCLY